MNNGKYTSEEKDLVNTIDEYLMHKRNNIQEVEKEVHKDILLENLSDQHNNHDLITSKELDNATEISEDNLPGKELIDVLEKENQNKLAIGQDEGTIS